MQSNNAGWIPFVGLKPRKWFVLLFTSSIAMRLIWFGVDSKRTHDSTVGRLANVQIKRLVLNSALKFIFENEIGRIGRIWTMTTSGADGTWWRTVLRFVGRKFDDRRWTCNRFRRRRFVGGCLLFIFFGPFMVYKFDEIFIETVVLLSFGKTFMGQRLAFGWVQFGRGLCVCFVVGCYTTDRKKNCWLDSRFSNNLTNFRLTSVLIWSLLKDDQCVSRCSNNAIGVGCRCGKQSSVCWQMQFEIAPKLQSPLNSILFYPTDCLRNITEMFGFIWFLGWIRLRFVLHIGCHFDWPSRKGVSRWKNCGRNGSEIDWLICCKICNELERLRKCRQSQGKKTMKLTF